MRHISKSRRRFLQYLTAGALAGRYPAQAKPISGPNGSSTGNSLLKLKVAAIQLSPKLADVKANLHQAEQLIQEALRKNAQWIALPEMFTSAAAFHPDMLKAIQPIDGAPLQLLKKLSRRGNAVIGGSFIAKHKQGVFNTFVLVLPDGSVLQHNKDFPTY